MIYNLGNKAVKYLICISFCRSVKRKNKTASVNKDSQWNKQEACFARATRVWLAVITTPVSLLANEFMFEVFCTCK